MAEPKVTQEEFINTVDEIVKEEIREWVNDLVVEPRGFLPHGKKIPVSTTNLQAVFSP